MMQSFLLFLLFGVLALGLLVLLLGLVSYRGMIHHRMRDEAYIRQAALDAEDFDASAIDLPWIEEDIASPGGYSLRVHALEPDVAQRAGKVAVFHHGIGWGWLGMIRYMELFREAGWAVVAYDSRGHGKLGGGVGDDGRRLRPSYGYYEKRDLAAVVDWAIGNDGRSGRFPFEGGFVVFGESMGAATVLQYAPLDRRLDAVIADCSYSSALGELKYRLRAVAVPPGLRELVVLTADALCRKLEGFSLRDANPEAAILETEVPILFIHGLEDRYVPYSMSLRMAESRKRKLPGAMTELLLVPGARHAQSIRADKGLYAEHLHEFLDAALAD
jgi:hypothetical protein